MNEHPKPHNPDPQRTGRVESNRAGNVVVGLRERQAGGVRPEAGGTAGFLTSVRNDQPGDADLNREIGDSLSIGNTTATPYYYGYDVLGNVSVISGDDGQEADQFEQDAFGNLVSGNWVTRVGHITEQITTKQYDVDLGLYYFSARWYDPLSGAFVSRDVSRLSSAVERHISHDCDCVRGVSAAGVSDILGNRTYSFVLALPTIFVDPSGNRVLPVWWADIEACLQSLTAYQDEAKRIFKVDPMGRQKHCYVCCKLATCFGPLGGAAGFWANVIWEIVHRPFVFGDVVMDLLECYKGGWLGMLTTITPEMCICRCKS